MWFEVYGDFYRLAKCLYELGQPQEAYTVLENFKEKFPHFANSSACKILKKDIKTALDSGKFLGHICNIFDIFQMLPILISIYVFVLKNI